MTEEEKRNHAQRIAQDWLIDIEFSYVHEDGELEGASNEDVNDIYTLIYGNMRAVFW